MPAREREPSKVGWGARLRLALGAAFLAVTGFLAWRGPRRRAATESRAAGEANERAARIARLRRRGHEPNDVAVGPIVAIGLLLILLVSASQLGLWFLFRTSTGTVPTPAAALRPLEAPVQGRDGLPTATVSALPDRLPVRPEDWQRLQAEQEGRLNSYGWVDRPNGVVHIPIERAIDLLVERGLPTREGR